MEKGYVWRVADAVRGLNVTISELLLTIGFVIKTNSNSQATFEMEISDFDENEKALFSDVLGEVGELKIMELSGTLAKNSEFDLSEINNFISEENSEIFSKIGGDRSEVIDELIIEMIKQTVHPVNTVLDIGSGESSFLLAAHEKKLGTKFLGEEVNEELATISKLRFKLINADVDIVNTNSLVFDEKKKSQSADVVYSNMPWDIRMSPTMGSAYLEKFNPVIALEMTSTSEWFFIDRVLQALQQGAHGYTIVPNSILFSKRDQNIRQSLIESGYLQAVVSLPSNLLKNTRLASTLLIFSGTKTNQSIFVDAASFGRVEGKKQKVSLDATDIKNIIAATFSGNENSKIATILPKSKVLELRDFALIPKRVIAGNPFDSIKNAEKLSDIAEIFRGEQLRREELDSKSLYLSGTTPKYVLQTADVNAGYVRKPTEEIPTAFFEKHNHCKLQSGDIVMSTRGEKVQIGIVLTDIANEYDMLVPNNLLVIRLKTAMYNPYYVMAFLNSEDGMRMIHLLSTGNSVPVLNVSQFTKQMVVPKMPLSQQKQIENIVIDKIETARFAEYQLEQYQQDIHNVMDIIVED